MSTRRTYTKEEDSLILSKVKENANNLQEAFRQAAIELERTPSGISYHWYTKLKDCGEVCFMTVGSKKVNSNRKNVTPQTSDNSEKIKKSWWRQAIAILLGK